MAVHLPGILNVLADRLSRPNTVLTTEWCLNEGVTQSLWAKWERPHIDLFATKANCRLQTFVSPVRDPQAFAVEALSLDWRGMFAYVFPPPKMLPQVLQKALESRPFKMILVAPY